VQPLQIGFYGVFDGHGGTRASEYVAGRLHAIVAERLAAGHTIR
jgi:serine/threonine protein phosphatase PrpC